MEEQYHNPHSLGLNKIIVNSVLESKLEVVVDGYELFTYRHEPTKTWISLGSYPATAFVCDDEVDITLIGSKRNLKKLKQLLN